LYYQTYLLFYLLSFLFLASIQTASSINGPLSNMEDENLLMNLRSKMIRIGLDIFNF
jgi:hypothetical protein